MDAALINQRLYESKESKIKTYPCNNLRASNVGHACERYLYLLIRHWDEQEPHGVGLQNIFDLGTHLESHAIQALKDAGFEVVTPVQRSWKIENPLITGREDIRIKDEAGSLLPAEIKWLSPYEYDKLNTQHDFLRSKRQYIRAYPAQLLVYMYHFEKENGFFILGNKLTGEVKAIDFSLDWDYADALIKKAERIYAALDANDPKMTLRTDDCDMCERCNLSHRCGAAIIHRETDIDVEGELAALIEEKASLAESSRQYDEVSKRIKTLMQGRDKVISGNYLIERREQRRASYTTKESTYDRIYIMKLGA